MYTTDLPWKDKAQVCDGSVVTIQHASFDGNVGGGSSFVEVCRTTIHREGDGLVTNRWGVGLFSAGVEYTKEEEDKMIELQFWIKKVIAF